MNDLREIVRSTFYVCHKFLNWGLNIWQINSNATNYSNINRQSLDSAANSRADCVSVCLEEPRNWTPIKADEQGFTTSHQLVARLFKVCQLIKPCYRFFTEKLITVTRVVTSVCWRGFVWRHAISSSGQFRRIYFHEQTVLDAKPTVFPLNPAPSSGTHTKSGSQISLHHSSRL